MPQFSHPGQTRAPLPVSYAVHSRGVCCKEGWLHTRVHTPPCHPAHVCILHGGCVSTRTLLPVNTRHVHTVCTLQGSVRAQHCARSPTVPDRCRRRDARHAPAETNTAIGSYGYRFWQLYGMFPFATAPGQDHIRGRWAF
jgi:hypothetical protein